MKNPELYLNTNDYNGLLLRCSDELTDEIRKASYCHIRKDIGRRGTDPKVEKFIGNIIAEEIRDQLMDVHSNICRRIYNEAPKKIDANPRENEISFGFFHSALDDLSRESRFTKINGEDGKHFYHYIYNDSLIGRASEYKNENFQY